MLRKGDFAVIKALHEQGVYQKDIAEQLGVHPKTVSRALKRDSAPPGKRAKQETKRFAGTRLSCNADMGPTHIREY